MQGSKIILMQLIRADHIDQNQHYLVFTFDKPAVLIRTSYSKRLLILLAFHTNTQ